MNPSIPAAPFVNVIPSVLAAGAPNLAMNAVFLDNSGDTSIPIGTVQEFASAAAVAAWYGPASVEATLAGIYFAGYNGGTQLPSELFFAQYNTAAVAAYVRGGTLGNTPLSAIQALSGIITININGDVVTTPNINLSGATSFTNAAALIQAGLDATGGSFAGTGSQALGVLTISAVSSGALHVGDTVTGAGVFGGSATILSFGTGSGGVGTYNVSTSGTATSGAVDVTSAATCTYDALRKAFVITSPTTGATSTIAFPTTDAFVTGLLLTAATGAVLSQGAAAAVPATLMNGIVAQTTDWATFMCVQDPDAGAAGGAIKIAFATWNATQNAAYMFVAYDSDPAPAASSSDAACFGALVSLIVGTDPIWSATQGPAVGAMHCAIAAAINYRAPGGRTTFAYRSSPAVVPDITSLTTFNNLKANGYNSYADVATRTAAFEWIQPGLISAAWAFIDSYVNQIYWNAAFQNDFAELLTQVSSIPYNQAGYSKIREALSADIQAMGAFGAWVAGGVLSGSQQVAVNTAAGLDIAPILQSQGWYLQITDPGPSARAARLSPIVTFWYFDGGSIQQIVMASIDVE